MQIKVSRFSSDNNEQDIEIRFSIYLFKDCFSSFFFVHFSFSFRALYNPYLAHANARDNTYQFFSRDAYSREYGISSRVPILCSVWPSSSHLIQSMSHLKSCVYSHGILFLPRLDTDMYLQFSLLVSACSTFLHVNYIYRLNFASKLRSYLLPHLSVRSNLRFWLSLPTFHEMTISPASSHFSNTCFSPLSSA